MISHNICVILVNRVKIEFYNNFFSGYLHKEYFFNFISIYGENKPLKKQTKLKCKNFLTEN